uniref:exodeoxyribonuclease V subunit beta n=1 Tax=Castellaniella defragrans TaxID=75697 RepID=UPI0033418363
MIRAADILPVDPLAFPLRGSRVIEASAGTGKTWTIAALYLRLVLGHGDLSVPPRLPAEILVLTFTEAASQELRDRVRGRLAQAAAYFYAGVQGGPAGGEADDFLRGLRAAIEQAQWPACARVLDLAAQSMDEAAIGTIHGWCARMLQEHAFDSGSLFDRRVEADLRAVEQEAVWDYWRLFVAPLDLARAAQVRAWWPGPAALHAALGGALHDDESAAPAPGSLEPLLNAAGERRALGLAALKAPWIEGAAEFGLWLESLGRDWPVAARYWQRWIADLRDWACDPLAEDLDLKTGWERLVPAGIAEKWRGAGPAPSHPLSERLAALKSALSDLPDGRIEAAGHALAWIADRLRGELARQARMGFDGLLGHLDSALEGPGGERLAQVLRAQYPVVLIDEFQDTDPVQYRIFDRIYRIAENRDDLCLVMIGDPKQAIYGFRGADIHAYLRARHACAGRVYTLECNFRSSQAMVAAVNACFSHADAHACGGAFPAPGEPEGIAFYPVGAQGREEIWRCGDEPAPALSIYWIDAAQPDRPLGSGDYEAQASDWCARRIAGLLSQGASGMAGFVCGADLQLVRPADIAVLVNTHAEARRVRQALARLGVRSVYLSERESVYETPQADELRHWLAACADPEDGRAVRTALATPALALSWWTLEHLAAGERAWEDVVARFQDYRACWRERGVLPMVRRLLHDFGVPARLLDDGREGERVLTDILHLAELLQQAAMRLDGEQALMRHLDEQCEGAPAGGDDARRVRLESDEDLVRVVTVHKSKGLEYPLVFLPFAARARVVQGDRGPYYLHERGRRRRVLRPDADQLAQLERERLAEDVRKLYVALTRARHAVWMAAGPLRNFDRDSALGHLLGGVPGGAQVALEQLVDAHVGIAWDMPVAADEAPVSWNPVGAELGAARVPRRSARAYAWWISSYSALRIEPGPRVAARTAQEDVYQEARRFDPPEAGDARGGTPPDASPGGAGLHAFPRGSEAGTFLHGLLEWAARRGFGALAHDEVRDMVARRCAVRDWSAWTDSLSDWLLRYARTEFWLASAPAPGLRLDALEAVLPEMEFWLPAAGVDVQRLDALVSAATLDGAPRPPAAPMRLNGMFKGFIDLALRHDGRYYVIDYKSNWLGPDAASYHPEAMRAAMLAARYDLQYVLYVFALHRQLAARLPDYDYDRHVGGAIYMFLRGWDAPGQGLFADRPARSLIEALDALFDGRGAV